MISIPMPVIAPQPEVPAIIPAPVSVAAKPGTFVFTSATKIVADASFLLAAQELQRDLKPSTGLPLTITKRGAKSAVTLKLDKGLTELGPEGYKLLVQPEGVEIRASGPAGAFYGVQTLRQLLPNAVFGSSATASKEWAIPCVEIEDKPRFTWRGMHLDVGRHFMPKDSVLKFIDLLAIHKFNTFHWHLTEDQGWRIEIKKYPKLTSVGAWRKDDMLVYSPAKFSGKPHGGFYTQAEVKEVVAYAKKRFVNIVPEIEMPGHAQAAIAAYPELGNTGKPVEVFTQWGVSEDVFNTNEKTLTFLKNVLTEVLALFPSSFIHLGGDECPKTQWKASAEAQAHIKELGLKDEHELQSWFVKQMDAWLAQKGRRLIGWDEILEGGLAPGATVMSWRGEEGGIAAAKANHDVVMTPNEYTYFDHYQAKDISTEPHAIGGYLPVEKVYAYEPVPHDLNEEQAKHVLGAQGQLWTEYIPDFKHVEYMAFPRACALSEVLWSPAASRNFGGFYTRLESHLERLKALDVNFRPLDAHAKAAATKK